MKPKVVALILVRMGSSRFPGKALCDISGTPMLKLIYSRVKRSKLVDDVVVCTSDCKENDAIELLCKSEGMSVFRGNEDDVSLRMYDALRHYKATTGVTIFGDCPFIEPTIIDRLISEFAKGGFDFVGNNLKTTYPPGTEAEVFTLDALNKGLETCDNLSIREHGTLVIRSQPDVFNIKNISAPSHLHRPEYEIEVDEKIDIEFIRIIAKQFEDNESVSLEEIISFLDDNRETVLINGDVNRRWKEYRRD
ncbi:cytidylyltransferase domain-containing protein [Vibrio genomosp. F10]|uniref:cytidylyltransferase domain-containing protein n=1 Tax=Vibrio genomosp. F10 TaxID=723171 RepID=UPI0002FAE029|nr:NTP transferase domain-containing protein [Vibrio genomosp. F10]OEF04570.1 hypothetical protein A1QI_10920 [Vibrio genomosp. F10 str. 9ZB36]